MSKFDPELNRALRRLIAESAEACQALLAREAAEPGSVLEPRACPICSDSEVKEHLSNGFFTYGRCKTCELLYMTPALTDGIVDEGFSDQDPWVRGYWALMESRMRLSDHPLPPDPKTHSILRDLLPVKPGGKLLDVGCSIGNFLAAARHFYDVEGLEINPRTAEIARSRGFQIHLRPLSELPGEAVYDAITMNQLLYGLKHPLEVLREAQRLLKPGGVLYLNTPHADSLAMRLYRGQHCHLLGKVNLNVFNQCSLRTAGEKAGLILTSFHTEWLNLYGLDVLTYVTRPDRFLHRRNSQMPFYEGICELEEHLQTRLLGNRFRDFGDYCVALLEKRPS